MIEIKKYSVEDACSILSEPTEENIQVARINQMAGPGYTAFVDGKPVACGGIRISGIGEAWALFHTELVLSEEDRQKAFLTSEKRRETVDQIAIQSAVWLDNMIRNESLWRLWSECPAPRPNQKFLKHMGFTKIEAFLRG